MARDYLGDPNDEDYDDDDDSYLFSPGWPLTWPSALFASDPYRGMGDDEEAAVEGYQEVDRDEVSRRTAEEEEGSWLDEGLITLLLVAGIALFVFPEPATSGLGILLITLGVLAWLFDLATPDT